MIKVSGEAGGLSNPAKSVGHADRFSLPQICRTRFSTRGGILLSNSAAAAASSLS